MQQNLSKTKYEVIVLGGGPSGAIAGIAAAQSGAKVLVVEKHGFLGGSLTAMGVGPMMSFHNSQGDQVVRGIPDQLINRLVARGASPGHIADTTTYCSTVTPFDAETLKIELEDMLIESGGNVLYHTHFAGLDVTDGKIETVWLCNKAGLTGYRAQVFIDATGDGDVCESAGVPLTMGREKDHAIQPMTANLKLANVDTQRIRQYVLEDPDNFEFEHGKEIAMRRLQGNLPISLKGFLREWNAAREAGEITIPREGILMFETPQPGVVILNTTRIQGLNPTDPIQLSEAERIGRKQCLELFQFVRKRLPGFDNAIRMDSSAQVGVRESRHSVGQLILTSEDLLTAREFDDVVALGGYPIDIHSPDEAVTNTTNLAEVSTYEIPLRALLPEAPMNLIIAGRCISATHEAMAAFRVSPITMAIGHGAGVTAAISVQQGVPPSLDLLPVIQSALLAQGAALPARIHR
jgi:ribulose 1,5-bisphosphate synthetase/thiazole synthase